MQVENLIQEADIIKNKRGRPKNPVRHLDDGTYNSKPLDKQYFDKYYHAKVYNRINCPFCNRETSKQKLSTHQSSKLCLKTRTQILI
jgi:hypothetical protein